MFHFCRTFPCLFPLSFIYHLQLRNKHRNYKLTKSQTNLYGNSFDLRLHKRKQIGFALGIDLVKAGWRWLPGKRPIKIFILKRVRDNNFFLFLIFCGFISHYTSITRWNDFKKTRMQLTVIWYVFFLFALFIFFLFRWRRVRI